MPEHLEKQDGVFVVNEKKVIAVIVEGSSDEAAFGSILKEYFSSEEIQFVVVHGDITTKDYTSADNIHEGKVEDFVEFISQEDLIAPGTFKQTWRFIEKEKHSLERFTNMHLIFNH